MITPLQKQLLQAAAQREAGSEGSLQQILIVALMFEDEDTIKYVREHFFNPKYYTAEVFEALRTMFAIEELKTTTVH